MSRVKTFTNGGSLLPGDLNSIEDDYEFAFSTYKSSLIERAAQHAAAAGAGTFVLNGPGSTTGGGVPGSTAPPTDAAWLDLADFLANTRTTKFRVRAQLITNAVAPAVTFTFGLYPVSTWGGASGAIPFINSLGAVVAGSTVAIATPGATSANQGNSGDFTAPAAGHYVLGYVVSGAPAANSAVTLRAELQVRQV